MNKIFFTSDTHFSHEFIAKKRGFSSIEEHDNFLIEQWNSVVDNGDCIYILGDFIWNKADEEHILKQLNGQKYVILGNHDKIGKHNEQIYNKYLIWYRTQHLLKIKNGENIPSTKIFLYHYPIEVWDSQHYSSYHFYGHVHGDCQHLKMRTDIPRRYDVGVDTNEYKPITFEEIVMKLKEQNLYETNYKEILRKRDENEKI
jgi:calcineurin-like phosphoesterase family protein